MFVNGDVALLAIKLLVVGSLLFASPLGRIVSGSSPGGPYALGSPGSTARMATRAVLGTMGVLAAAVLGFLALAKLRWTVSGPHGQDVLSRLPGMLVVIDLQYAVLGMACHVLIRSKLGRRAKWLSRAPRRQACSCSFET